MPDATPLFTASGLTKAYPGVLANDAVSLEIAEGEIHALLGENGAGKSTLVGMIYGLTRPDAGTMSLSGAPHTPSSPQDARASGVAMVFQHFSLFPAMTVAENVALGMADPPPMRDLSARIAEVSEDFGLPLDPARIVGDLSAGERQRVEIIRCLLQDPRLLIMDEPTSVLTPQEVEILFDTLHKLTAQGVAILYISHKLDEVRAHCDRATILRHGRVVGACDPSEMTPHALAEAMVGDSLRAPARGGAATEGSAVALTLKGLSLPPASAFGTALHDLHLEVRCGEVLGIGGVAGNGQDELLTALAGERRAPAGTLLLDGDDIGALGPVERRKLGLLAAPEERLGHAAAPDLSLTDNTLLSAVGRRALAPGGMIRRPRARAFAEEIIARFDVRTPGPLAAARALSGGNLQKFLIGREVLQDPRVLVVNQPTWGVDARAASAIRQALLDLAAQGAAVVVISQDLDELMEVADRFAALNAGRLSAPQPTRGLDVGQIGLMLGGAHDMHAAHIGGAS